MTNRAANSLRPSVTQASACAFIRVHRSSSAAESGFAMLFVFVLAALIAIGLYQQLPRAAFEAQREKEQLLIDHGEQYVRGVQLYVRKMQRYPAKIEDLDNTQNIRFLRRHYLDPMTGKDEWRLLHMGPAGKLIDSKIQSKDQNQEQAINNSISNFRPNTDDGGPENTNLATRKRPSDDQAPAAMPGATPSANPTASTGLPGMTAGGGLPGLPPIPGQSPSAVPNPNNPQANAANNSNTYSGSISGNGGYGSISGNGGYGTTNTTTPAPNQPRQPSLPGQPGQPMQAGVNGMMGQSNVPGAMGTGFQSPYPTNPGSNQANTGNFGQPGNSAAAANMINGLLTSPRPGGPPPGVMGGPVGNIGGGLAGVASTYKGKGVKRYNDQEDYDKWEFYYDLSKELAAATTGAANAAQQQQQPPGQQQQTQPGFGTFGNQSTPSNSGFTFGNPGVQPSAPPAPPPPPTQ